MVIVPCTVAIRWNVAEKGLTSRYSKIRKQLIIKTNGTTRHINNIYFIY